MKAIRKLLLRLLQKEQRWVSGMMEGYNTEEPAGEPSLTISSPFSISSCSNCPFRIIDPEHVFCGLPGSRRDKNVTKFYDNDTLPKWCPLPESLDRDLVVQRYKS